MKTKNWFETGFQQPKTSLTKNGINITRGNVFLRPVLRDE